MDKFDLPDLPDDLPPLPDHYDFVLLPGMTKEEITEGRATALFINNRAAFEKANEIYMDFYQMGYFNIVSCEQNFFQATCYLITQRDEQALEAAEIKSSPWHKFYFQCCLHGWFEDQMQSKATQKETETEIDEVTRSRADALRADYPDAYKKANEYYDELSALVPCDQTTYQAYCYQIIKKDPEVEPLWRDSKSVYSLFHFACFMNHWFDE